MIESDLFLPIREHLEAVEAEIARIADSPVGLIHKITNHAIRNGGKRLRPCLTLLSARAVGEITRDVIALAALVELTHTAALIHDDVVDDAQLRRGCSSVNQVWGNEAAVLAGDHLFARVMVELARQNLVPFMPILALAINCMCRGQLLELELRKNADVLEHEYLQLTQDKTAELIGAASELGARGASRCNLAFDALRSYGMNLGLAFQITDDVLDIVSDSTALGKPVSSDLRGGRVTLPYIRTLAVAEAGERQRLRQIFALKDLDEGALQEATCIVHGHDGIQYSRETAGKYAAAAQHALNPLPPSPAKEILVVIASLVVSRCS